MRAAWITAFGSPDVITVGDLPVPTPGPSDVLIRVAAVAVNHVDTFVRSGAYRTPLSFPFVIGRDVVGTIATADAAGRFAIGDPVWSNSLGVGGLQGPTAEFVVAPVDRVYRLPAGIEPTDAVGLLHPLATAFLAITVHGEVQAGNDVFIAGGAGQVGSAAVVIAARAGARVIASASAADLDDCTAIGAAGAVDYRSPDLRDELRDLAPHGFDVSLDTSGRVDLDVAVDLLADRGRLVLMSGIAHRTSLPVGALYTRDRQIRGFAISNATTTELAMAAVRINALLAERAITSRRVEVVPFAEAAAVHRRLETGTDEGARWVLVPDAATPSREVP